MGNYDIAKIIIDEALKENVPVNLAFALCMKESTFNPTAFNKNKNGSIDRGLFQLNNYYRPKMEEKEYYNS